LVIVANTLAQRMDLTGGTIGVSASVLPARSLKDTTGNYGYKVAAVNFSLPLIGNRDKVSQHKAKDGFAHFYQTSVHAGFDVMNSNIGFIANQRNFYNGSAGLGGMFFNGKKNIIIADANIGFASDGIVIQNHAIEYRFTGNFIVNHIQNPTLTYQYGIVMTYAYGRPLPLPILGIRKKFSDSWSLSAILPVNLQVTDRLNKTMGISFLIRPAGNRFQFQNQQNFNTTSATVYMQLRQFEAGASYIYRISKSFSFDAEAGFLGGGNLKFTEMNNSKSVLYQTGVQSGPKLRISFRYHLPHKRMKGNNIDMDGELFHVN